MPRVRQEINKMLLSPYAENGFRLLMTSGLINAPCLTKEKGVNNYVTPLQPLAHLYKLKQNTEHHIFDAWEHTLHALQVTPKNDMMLRYAVLFHDSAKGLKEIRGTRDDGQPTDYNHEIKSAEIVYHALRDGFGFSDKEAKYASWLVRRSVQSPPCCDRHPHVRDTYRYSLPATMVGL